jgi:hypothetical protein
MKTNMNTTETKNQNTVTDIQTDSFGRAWGKLNGKRVMLTYAIDPNGTWLDDEGNYHFEAK